MATCFSQEKAGTLLTKDHHEAFGSHKIASSDDLVQSELDQMSMVGGIPISMGPGCRILTGFGSGTEPTPDLEPTNFRRERQQDWKRDDNSTGVPDMRTEGLAKPPNLIPLSTLPCL
jgi:hypothetical protein